MTIEIRQLVIRAVVEPTREADRGDAAHRTAPTVRPGAVADTRATHEAIVAACVREVLRALARSRGR